MGNSKAMASIKAAITRFDRASQDFAFIGAQAPENHSMIEQEYTLSRRSLERMIERHLSDR